MPHQQPDNRQPDGDDEEWARIQEFVAAFLRDAPPPSPELIEELRRLLPRPQPKPEDTDD
jgi:hypothetical protein